jgi:transcriptional regulator with XRE-family HTH domain
MLRDILAERLLALMAARPDLDTQVKVAKRAGISQSTVGRVLSRTVHTGLDVLEQLGEAFGVHPLSLVSDPRDMAHGDAAAYDYLERRLLEAWRRLSPSQQHAVMGYIEVATTRFGFSLPADAKPVTESGAVDVISEVPAGDKAAVRRAASRPPGKDFEQALDNDRIESGNKQAATKRRGR